VGAKRVILMLSVVVGAGVVALILNRPREVKVSVGPSWTPAPEQAAEPVAPPPAAAPSAAPTTAAHNGHASETSSRPLNINTATAEQLAALPGIGPKLAERIIAYRTQKGGFVSVDDLDAVSGIGAHLIDSLRPYIAVSD
jgi:competence protein ComEA